MLPLEAKNRKKCRQKVVFVEKWTKSSEKKECHKIVLLLVFYAIVNI